LFWNYSYGKTIFKKKEKKGEMAHRTLKIDPRHPVSPMENIYN
jgi:hypothetical protein